MNKQLLTAALQRITAANEGIPREGVEVKFRLTGSKGIYVPSIAPGPKFTTYIPGGADFYVRHNGGVIFLKTREKWIPISPASARELAKQCVRMDAKREREVDKLLTRCSKVIKSFQSSVKGVGSSKVLEELRTQLGPLITEYDSAAKAWDLAKCDALVSRVEVLLKKAAGLPARGAIKMPVDYLKQMLRVIRGATNYWDDEPEGALFLLVDLMDWLTLAAAANERNLPLVRKIRDGVSTWGEPMLPDELYEHIDNL